MRDALDTFRPTEKQEWFFREICRGTPEVHMVGKNRTGKTLCGAMAITAMFQDIPITFAGCAQVSMRRPSWRHGPVNILVVGYDWDHVRHLGRSLLDDQSIGRGIAPPLINEDEVTIYWENRRDRIPSRIVSHDGCRIDFVSSQVHHSGDSPHCVWIDEGLENESMYAEFLLKLVDFKGTMIRTRTENSA